MNRDQEKAIIQCVLDGDTEAFRLVVEQYQRLVAHIVFRMIPHVHTREDLCQDVFVKVYRNLKTYRFQSKLSTWIAKIAYNRCLNYLEKKKVPLFEDMTPDDVGIDDFSMAVNQPENDVINLDLIDRVKKTIEKLPVKYRTVITLYHLEAMKYDEIAEIMQLPEGTVKSYLFRARKALKDLISAKYTKEELVN